MSVMSHPSTEYNIQFMNTTFDRLENDYLSQDNNTSPLASTISPDDEKCMITLMFYVFVYGMRILLAILTLVFLSFCYESPNPIKRCIQRPRLVLPLNLMSYHNRLDYMCAFGSMALQIIGVIVNAGLNETPGCTNKICTILSTYANALMISLLFFPLFATLAAKDSAPVSIVGFLYSSTILADMTFEMLIFTFFCNTEKDDVAYKFMQYFPQCLCMVWLTCKMLYKCCSDVYHGKWRRIRNPDFHVCDFQVNHVKELLTNEDPSKFNSITNQGIFKKYIYDANRHFRFSNRILCSCSVLFFGAYSMALIIYDTGYRIKQMIIQFLIAKFDTSEIDADEVSHVFIRTWFLLSLICVLLLAWHIILILSNYRTNSLQLWRGDNSFTPKGFKLDLRSMVAVTSRFAGYQISYMVWAAVIYLLLAFIATLLITMVSYYVIIEDYKMFWTFFYSGGIPTMLGFSVYFLGAFLSKWLFVEHIEDVAYSCYTSLTNMASFPVFDFIFFFVNISAGLFASLGRILQGMALGVFFLGRLDQCVLMSRFANTDRGFKCYVGMLVMEEHYNHPVMRVFCSILLGYHPLKEMFPNTASTRNERSPNTTHSGTELDPLLTQSISENKESKVMTQIMKMFSTDKRSRNTRTIISDSDSVSSPTTENGAKTKRSESCAKTRWFIAYTLIRNPSLAMNRKQYILEKRHLNDFPQSTLSAANVDPTVTYINYEGQTHAITRQNSLMTVQK